MRRRLSPADHGESGKDVPAFDRDCLAGRPFAGRLVHVTALALWVVAAATASDGFGQAMTAEPDFATVLRRELTDAATAANEPLTRLRADEAVQRLGERWLAAMRAERAAEHAAKVIPMGELSMPFEFRVFGERPPTGFPLYISMHGGGGAAKRVNDRQWENQKRLYEPELGIYVAPRAPTDTWNLWHESHIDAFLQRLIENMVVLEGVDPDRVYLTGYSAGGDGVFQLAPRMADRFAAAAMMAGHPNETSPLGLRNLPFTLHMGAQDAAYDRNAKAVQWKQSLAELHLADPGGYEHWVEIHEGKGHWMDRQDARGVTWMAQFRRNRIPERVVWHQDDVLHDRFYWLAVPAGRAKPRQTVVASRLGQRVTIHQSDADELIVLLRDDMLDLDLPVEIEFDGDVIFRGPCERTSENLVRGLIERGDPSSLFSASIPVKLR